MPRYNRLMLVSLTALACAGCAEVPFRDVNHYVISGRLDPESRSLTASVEFTFKNIDSPMDSATFFLHNQLEIESVSGPRVAGFDFDTAAAARAPWLREAGILTVRFSATVEAGEATSIEFVYAGTVDRWPSWSANVISDEWVEIGLYLPWFPYNYDEYGPFTYELGFEVDRGFAVRAHGETDIEGRLWRFETRTPTSDIVLVAAPDLRTSTFTSGSTSVRVHHANLSEEAVARAGETASHAMSNYGKWFGAIDLSDFTIVASERELGGGYARPGLVVITDLEDLGDPEHRSDFLRYLGHETAHLWWRGAETNSWEDWLNESFAEYSALGLLEEELGESEFVRRLEEKELRSQNTAPIWGFDRGDASTPESRDEIQRILYDKGPVLLNEIAARIGRDQFDGWCQALLYRQLRTTREALEMLGETADAETAQWFEAQLKTR